MAVSTRIENELTSRNDRSITLNLDEKTIENLSRSAVRNARVCRIRLGTPWTVDRSELIEW